jgi:hypothetical protein
MTMPDENEKSPETPKPEEPPKAQWEFKKNMGINEEMKKVVNLTISATHSEIAVLRRKLSKLTYGS